MATASGTGALGFGTSSSSTAMTRDMITIGTFDNPIKITKLEFSGSGNLSGNAHNFNRKLTYTLVGSKKGSYTIYSAIPPASGGLSVVPGTSKTLNTEFQGTIKITLNVSGSATSSSTHWGRIGSGYTATITYENAYTACTAPTTVAVSRVRGVVTIGWAGATAGTSNPITGYKVIRNTSASDSGATTIYSKVTTGNQTNSPGAGTFYYGVQTIGTASGYDSGYKWSGAITVPNKPSVSAGTVITDTQMDDLRTWINSSSITDIADGATVRASEGNTYYNTLAAGTSTIDAAWYNAAANG